MRRAWVVVVLAGVALAGCGGHGRDAVTGQPIVTKSPDSAAPRGAPAHWLPPEAWVYNHWLPYDETRLYRLLGITREGLWRQLRDDRRTLAQLAGRPGWGDPRRLPAALASPGREQVGARRAAELEARALR